MPTFTIEHTTWYSYSEKVFLEPHLLRFKPKSSRQIEIHDFELKISPNPAGFSEQLDVENNRLYLCWFENTHDSLTIRSSLKVGIKEFNPFDFLIHPPEFSRLPFTYSDHTKELLHASLQPLDLSAELIVYVNELMKQSNHQTIPFISKLTSKIHSDFEVKRREKGVPHYPDHTFKKKSGSCRDLAWMQIQMLRHSGIASRFVSGYYYINDVQPEFELHAWVEAYIPGAGWIGFDPSNGLLAGVNHVPVASSAFYSNAMPVTGNIRGNATTQLTTSLNIEMIQDTAN